MLFTASRYPCFRVFFLTHISHITNVVYCFQLSVISFNVFVNTYFIPYQYCLLFSGIRIFVQCLCQHIFHTIPMLFTVSRYPCFRALLLSTHISHLNNVVYSLQVPYFRAMFLLSYISHLANVVYCVQVSVF